VYASIFRKGQRIARCLALAFVSTLLVHAAALAQTYSCDSYDLADIGQELPDTMWSDIGYALTETLDVRATTREAACARIGASVRRGASHQSGNLCLSGCVPSHTWQDGPHYYCESPVDQNSRFYRPLRLLAKHRCADTTAALSGPGRIPNHLKGTEPGVDLKLQLSEHALYFSNVWHFSVPTGNISVRTDQPGPDNRLSSDFRQFLQLPPMRNGNYLVDERGAYQFKLLPHKLFLSRPVKPQVITVSATCNGCRNVATWDIRVGPPEVVIGFFNGVGNTGEAAQESLNRLQRELGSRYEDSPLKYDWFYNQTACGEGIMGKPSCLEDLAEVFEQRSIELGGVFANRWETFWDIVASRHQQATSLTGRLVNLLGPGSNALLQWLDASVNAILNQLVRDTLKLLTLFKDSPTYENRADHMERLWRYADNGDSMVLVAHSQGNLFVNSAFDALKSFKPDAQARVVHVAPASPTLRGDYVLADIDLVINALRVSGLNSVPDVNIRLPFSSEDKAGHGFDPTYLDKTRAAHSRTMGLITNSLEALAL